MFLCCGRALRNECTTHFWVDSWLRNCWFMIESVIFWKCVKHLGMQKHSWAHTQTLTWITLWGIVQHFPLHVPCNYRHKLQSSCEMTALFWDDKRNTHTHTHKFARYAFSHPKIQQCSNKWRYTTAHMHTHTNTHSSGGGDNETLSIL